jgi:hypothetical protein
MDPPRLNPTAGGRCEEHRSPAAGAEGTGRLRSMAGKRSLRLSSLLVVVVVLPVVAVFSVVNAPGVARPSHSRWSAAEAHPARGPVTRAASPAKAPGSARVSAYLADLPAAESATSDQLAADTPGMPDCAPPPMPAATYPPGAAYGVPFLAAITNGQVLAGYDEWTANNLVWTVGNTTYNLYPWQSKIYDITGWVTGLLQLPSLTAEIAPQDVVFCDEGGANCLSANWPAGECVQIEAQYGPSPASKTPPPALGSSHPEGTSCSDYSTPTFECFPYVVSLTPSGTTSLTVSGVEPDGALDATVTTGAVTTVSEVPPPPSTSTFTCQAAPTSVTLSTTAEGVPATAPPPPTPPETDYRPLQTPPLPITGPLIGSTSTVASNDFSVPAFVPNTTGTSPCSDFLATSLNTYAGGWDAVFKDQDLGLYYIDGGTNPTVAEPGWAQFTATTTVVNVGLPTGPPSGFSF